MRGHTNYNFQAFENGQRYLEWLGHEVVSPHEIDLQEQLVFAHYTWIRDWDHGLSYRLFQRVWNNVGFDFKTAMRRDIEALLTVDAISFLPGSDRSEGARIERTVAKGLRLSMNIHSPWLYFCAEPPSAFEQVA